jgi:hypothetical protein
VTEDSAPLSPIIMPNSSISIPTLTITSTKETLGTTEGISPAGSGATGLVDNAGSTNLKVLLYFLCVNYFIF